MNHAIAEKVKRLTGGGADGAIEALCMQETFRIGVSGQVSELKPGA
jgi:hypothetical protein